MITNIDELKSTGLKATLPRLKILEIFQKAAERHMTAEDVFRVLLEAAVRNTILQLRGIDTYQEFVERHRRAMERDSGV